MSVVLLGLFGCGADDAGDPAADPGSRFGEVVPELQLWGYVRTETSGLATDSTLGPVSWESIRQSTTRTHALIHVSGFT